jgi:glycosyltransferase involved in cell wall biosynthesis
MIEENKNIRILIISLSDISSDARVLKQVKLLSRYYSVDTLSRGESKVSGVRSYKFELGTPYNLPIPEKAKRFIFRKVFLLFGRYDKYLENSFVVEPRFFDELREKKYSLIIVNDLITLPFAFKIKGNAKIYFDAHEYYPKEFEDVPRWRILFQKHIDNLCKIYIPKVDAMTTVCESIALEYEKNYGVRPEVVMNASPYKENLYPSNISNPIKIVHHGNTIPSRKLELMIEMMKYLDERYELDLFLVPTNLQYLNKLKEVAKNYKRVKVLPPIPYENLIENLNKYDIGVYILPPDNFNHRYALPNKIFDFVQARLCIAVSPSPEMARIVRDYKLGVIADDFSPRSLADKISSLSGDDIMYYKMQSHKWARKLSAEEEDKKTLKIVQKLIE